MATLTREIVEQVAMEFNVSKKTVESLYQLYWKHIENFIQSRTLDIPGKCNKYTDIIIPHIGRLVLNLNKKRSINERKQRKLYGNAEGNPSYSKSNKNDC